ncbi:uncharacterized protein [Nicotiana sylvestris]|uniref:uncharacterized protein n=1 Tax=Nicotiana sylvestris TaxID=4096 RepID=UPI00388CBE82
MDGLVDNCQSTFVLGRIITNNIILSHELVKGYGRKGISPRCMIKLDMQKAYDSLKWSYLEQVLIGLGFPDKGDTISVKLLYDCFLNFSQVSGLKVNQSKSSVFFGGVAAVT